MAELSVMVLCGSSPRHVYVANSLCRGANVVAIVQEIGTHWTLKKGLVLLRPDNLFRKVRRWLRDRRHYVGRSEAKFFFGDLEAEFDSPGLVKMVPYINDRRVLALADELRPDVIAVFGTSLIRGELLTRGRLGIINLHGGISPEYRGADCTFWALYNDEPEKVGCTLHFIDAGIDSGNLIAHVCPEVHEGDDELTLFWRGIRDSADVYVAALERMARGEPLGERQKIKGTLYKVRDRGRQQERFLEMRLAGGLLKGVHMPKRLTWYGTTTLAERGSACH